MAETTVSFLQTLMETAHDSLQSNIGTRKEIFQFVTAQQRAAYQLGTFNSHVRTIGLGQWFLDGYYDEDFIDLLHYAERGYVQHIPLFDKFLKVMESIRQLGKPQDYTGLDIDICEDCLGHGIDDDGQPCQTCHGRGDMTVTTNGENVFSERIDFLNETFDLIEENQLLVSVEEFLTRWEESIETANVIKFQRQRNPYRPRCNFIGEDGNVFNLIAVAAKTLQQHGLTNQALQMQLDIHNAKNYEEALGIIERYVEIF
jgi:hypothetical protein